MMEKEHSNERKNDNGKNSTIHEKVKRNNLMDWGIVELPESVQQEKTRKS